MNLDQWCKLGDWHEAVRDSLSQLLPATAGDANAETLRALRLRFLDAFERLRTNLLPGLSERDVNQLLLPLVLHSDEKVLSRLRPGDRHFWPLLQRELYGVENGGDLFYDLADEQLGAGADAQGLREVLLFCLQDGFRGRYGDSPTRIQSYRTKLAAHLAPPPPTSPAAAAAPEIFPMAHGPEAPTPLLKGVFFSVTAAVILAMPFLFVWLSNFFSVKE